MIEIVITHDKASTKKLVNPTNFILSKSKDRYMTAQAEEFGTLECDDAQDIHVLPAEGDQRIWQIANLGNGITPELYLSQYRVIGFKVVRDLFTDRTEVLPLSTGLQWEALEGGGNHAVFLVDMNLKQISVISVRDGNASIYEGDQNTDIMGSISEALKIPLLCESDLPVELKDYLKQNTELKKVANLK